MSKNYSASHTQRCYCPGCNYSVTKTATSDTSQSDADNKAESACQQAFGSHNCPCR